MTFDAILADARKFLGATDPAAKTTARNLLEAASEFTTYPQPPHQLPLLCVDGALATTQTDALVWTAASAGTSGSEPPIIHGAVAPVGPAADRISGATMALAEMQMAVKASLGHREVWMDGGLATPLISLSTALTDPNKHISASLAGVLERADSLETVAAYVELATQGRLLALPKQDTARAFSQHWAHIYAQEPALKDWLASRSDRSLTMALLSRGERTRTRTADEALRVEIKNVSTTPPTSKLWAEAMNPIFARWRTEVSAHIAYVMPRHGIGRPIKIEMTTDNPQTAESRMDQAASIVDSQIVGPHIIEPLPQHLVDITVKRAVSSGIIDLMGAVTSSFIATHPEATGKYRS